MPATRLIARGVLTMIVATGGFAGDPPAETASTGEAESGPRLLATVDPGYPSAARHARMKGHVKLRFVVDESGDVRNVEVLSSSVPLFEAPASHAVRQWRFSPAVRDGRTIDAEQIVRVDFDLEVEAGASKPEIWPRFTYTFDATAEPDAATTAPSRSAWDGSPNPARDAEGLAVPYSGTSAEMPELSARVDPVIPEAVLHEIGGGRVLVEIALAADGTVKRARVAKSTDPRLDNAVIAAVNDWRYELPDPSGRRVATVFMVVVDVGNWDGRAP